MTGSRPGQAPAAEAGLRRATTTPPPPARLGPLTVTATILGVLTALVVGALQGSLASGAYSALAAVAVVGVIAWQVHRLRRHSRHRPS